MNPETDDQRLRKLEYQLWGFSGANGLVSEVRGLRSEIHAMRNEQLARDTDAREERKKDRRWWIGIGISVVMALLVAAQMVASA